MKRLIDVLKALGEENRFRIVMMLRERPLCVCEVCAVLDISLSTVSTHLRQLTQAGILQSEKDGRWVIYRLSDVPFVRKLVEQLRREVTDDSSLERDLARIVEVSPASCAGLLKQNRKERVNR